MESTSKTGLSFNYILENHTMHVFLRESKYLIDLLSAYRLVFQNNEKQTHKDNDVLLVNSVLLDMCYSTLMGSGH